MTDYVQNLELQIKEKDNLAGIVGNLKQELKACKSENSTLMKKLEDKEHELHSALYIEKLEETISYIALDFQCDIESMKLDLIIMEHSFLEAKKLQEINKELREKLTIFEINANSETKIQEYELLLNQLKVC